MTRLLALAVSAILFAVVDYSAAESVADDCELDPALYDACMVGVNTSYNACMGSGATPEECDWARFVGEATCWIQYCLVIPDPGE